jgi:hypothetical protein
MGDEVTLPDIPVDSWEKALRETELKFVRFFSPEPEEKLLYKELLLGLASLDPERTRRALEGGAEELLTRYDPESNSFGIHALLDDLYALRLKVFASRDKRAFFDYMRYFVVFAQNFIHLDPNVYAKRSPHWSKFLENGKRALWIRMYRTVLQEMPFSLRRALEPIVRQVADYYVYEMETWAREDLTVEEKAHLLEGKYREVKAKIEEKLKSLGLDPGLLDPRGGTAPGNLPPWERKRSGLRKEDGNASWIF